MMMMMEWTTMRSRCWGMMLMEVKENDCLCERCYVRRKASTAVT